MTSQVNNNYISTTQLTGTGSAADSAAGTTGASTSSVDSAAYLVEMITDLVMGLESQQSSAGLSSATLLPNTTEPASSGASDMTSNAFAALGDAVGIGMASASTSVDWQQFASQTQTAFTQAGFSQADIDTYLGGVMQGFLQGSGDMASASTGTTSVTSPVAASSAVAMPAAASTANAQITASIASPQATTSSATVTAVSGNANAIPVSLLPSVSTSASQFTTLGQQAFNSAAGSLSSNLNIESYVANTQTEMENAGYDTDQITNYMTGIYEAYNTYGANGAGSTATATVTATSSAAATGNEIADSALPSLGTSAGSFITLGQQAYQAMEADLGSGVDINSFVANTQLEMENDGYSSDQITNYMTGIDEAYDASPAAQPASTITAGTSTTTSGTSTTTASTSGSNTDNNYNAPAYVEPDTTSYNDTDYDDYNANNNPDD